MSDPYGPPQPYEPRSTGSGSGDPRSQPSGADPASASGPGYAQPPGYGAAPQPDQGPYPAGDPYPPAAAGYPSQTPPAPQPGQGWSQPGQTYPQPGQTYPGQAYPGQQYPGQQYPAADAGYPAAPGYPQAGFPPAGSYPAGLPAAPLRTDYASWGKRVGAMLLDGFPSYVGLAVFYVGYALWIIAVAQSGSPSPSAGVIPMVIGGAIMLGGLAWNVYNRWLIAGRTGQSWGKRVTKIRLISEQTGLPIGATNAFLRDIVHTVDGMAYIGYLWPLWDAKKQTFADKLMNTVVVDAPPR